MWQLKTIVFLHWCLIRAVRSIIKLKLIWASSSVTGVEHSPHHPKFKGFSPTPAEKKMVTSFQIKVKDV
jgi:hypothetical protein